LAPEFGDGGGGPEYVDTRSGFGDRDRVPARPVVRGIFRTFPDLFSTTDDESSFREYLAELDRTNPVSGRTGDLDGDRESDLTRI